MSYSIIAKRIIKSCRFYWKGYGGVFYIKRRNLCISSSFLYMKMQEQFFKWSWKRTHSLAGSHRVNIWSSCGLISLCITWIEYIKWSMGECKIKLANTTKAKIQRCVFCFLKTYNFSDILQKRWRMYSKYSVVDK